MIKLFKCIYWYRNFYSLISFFEFVKVLFNNKNNLQTKLKNGMRIYLRGGNLNDLIVAKYVFLGKHHHPLLPLRHNPTILDLGANIGFTVLDFKNLYPKAKIISVELDEENYNLCLKNTKQLEETIIINGGVWHENCIIEYSSNSKSDSFSISKSKLSNATSLKRCNAVTIGDLIRKYSISEIDYMKMDIEGAEREVFEKGDLNWLKLVKLINIEIHHEADYSLIMQILHENGFNLLNQNSHWSSIFARNKFNG